MLLTKLKYRKKLVSFLASVTNELYPGQLTGEKVLKIEKNLFSEQISWDAI